MTIEFAFITCCSAIGYNWQNLPIPRKGIACYAPALKAH